MSLSKSERDNLVIVNMPYARSLSRGFSGKHQLDHIEAESAAMSALVIASADYDPETGVRFRTYATHKIFGYMRHALDTEIRHSGPEVCSDLHNFEPSDALIDRIDAGDIINSIKDTDAQEAALRLAMGERASHIAKEKGVSPSTIKRRADRATKEVQRRIN